MVEEKESESKIQKIMIQEVTDSCPVCGYTDGFHVSFRKDSGNIRIILICPDCHARFDPEWDAKFAQEYTY